MSDAARRSRPALAFLVDNLYDRFEAAIWGAVADAARAEGVDLFCFLGGNLGSGPEARNLVFDLVGPERIDGVIAAFSSICSFAPPEAAHALAARFAPLPVVSLGMELPGATSLLVANERGMAALVDHVAGTHRRRRIAFVRGPPVNAEAEARFRAYRDGLARHGLAFEPALVFQGWFDRDSGRQAVDALFDGPGPAPDALLAANDDMASHALRALQQRGLRVPDDVLVAGFDDVLAAGALIPALTTVRQPLRAIGEEAIRLVLALLRGETVPAVTVLPTELVIRRSCGCGPSSWGGLGPPRSVPALDRPAAAAAPAVPLDAEALADAVSARFPNLERRLGAGFALPIARALAGEPSDGGDERPLLAALEVLAARGVRDRVGVAEWRPAVELLLSEVRRGAPPGRAAALEAALPAFLSELARQAETALRIKGDEEAEILRRVSPPTQVSEGEFRRVVQAALPALGMRSFFLCRYEPGDLDRVSLFLHYDLDGAVALDAPGPFDPRRLVPGRFAPERRHAYAVVPVHYREERIGHAVCQLGPMELVGYEVLGHQLGTSLQVGALMGVVRRHSAELEERVDARTRELRELHARLVETAHRAGMAEIAIGVMHNVGNLLNSVNVSADRIGEVAGRLGLDGLHRVAELLEAHRGALPAFFAGDPRAPLLVEYLRKAGQALEGERVRIQAEARELTAKTALIRETVRGLQERARGERDVPQLEPVELAAVADVALRLQEPALLRYGIEVRRSFHPTGRVLAQRVRLVHVLVNLVKNAVEAMRDTQGARRLALEIAQRDGCAVVRVEDSGEGIRPEHLARLFTYGFTTKPDGHGFGLHFCREHVAALGGTLTAQSEGPGQGATFTVALPTPEAA